MTTRRNFNLALAGTAALGLGSAAVAQPARRFMTLVIPYTPGGSTDIIGRLFATALGAQLGETVVVENRPGGGGTVGSQYVANAAPDGRTLLYTLGNLLLNQEFLLKGVAFRPLDSLQPLARTCVLQVVIVTRASHPARDLREFIDMARKNPGKHSFAYYGDLGIPSMASAAGIDLIRVPYKGGAPGLVDVTAGNVDIIASSLTQALPLLSAGKIKILAVSADERLADHPSVPTVKEVEPGYQSVDYQGLFLPKGTPAAVVESLWQATQRIVSNPDFRRSLLERGALPSALAPDAFQKFVLQDHANIKRTVEVAGIQAE